VHSDTVPLARHHASDADIAGQRQMGHQATGREIDGGRRETDHGFASGSIAPL
jgi:hypothetical protein